MSRQISVGDDLIDRRAGLHVGAFGLLRVRAAHERRRGARVLPADVALVGRREVVEPGEDERPVAKGLERLQDRRQREAGAFRGGRPVVHVGAIPAIDRREPRRRLRLAAHGRHHRVQKRQRHGGAHSADERPAWQR